MPTACGSCIGRGSEYDSPYGDCLQQSRWHLSQLLTCNLVTSDNILKYYNIISQLYFNDYGFLSNGNS